MAFLKSLLVAFVVVVIAMAYQVDAMNWRNTCQKIQPLLTETETIMLEESRASDFQIYQLLSEVTRNNSELYLSDDVTKIIATNACGITEKLRSDCYKKYGAWLCAPDSILTFIKDRLREKVTDHTAIVTVLKTCLNYSGKSLDQIQSYEEKTVLHCLSSINSVLRLNCVKILLLVAGDRAWDLIIIQDDIGYTVLHLNSCSSELVNELLSAAPSSEAQWKLICTEINDGDTVFYRLLGRQFDADIVKKLLATAPSPEQAWLLINAPNCEGNTVLDITLAEGVREVLESYRPLNL